LQRLQEMVQNVKNLLSYPSPSTVVKTVKKFTWLENIFIPVTRRVKGHTRFIGMYVTGRRKRFRPHQVCIILISIISQVDLAMSICPVRMNAEISETIQVSGWTLRSRKLWELSGWTLRSRKLWELSPDERWDLGNYKS